MEGGEGEEQTPVKFPDFEALRSYIFVGFRNVSHCQQQQSYSGLRSPGDQTQPTIAFSLTIKFD